LAKTKPKIQILNHVQYKLPFFLEGDRRMNLKHNWIIEELWELYNLPLMTLLSKAHHIHTQFHQPNEVQICNLISIKTGGCPENCKYCAQSSRYQTPVSAQPMMNCEEVIQEAAAAIQRGATRICLGAAWREIRNNRQFEEVLKMIQSITSMGAEVCCTLGMLKPEQAKRLKEAGLYAYNHNLDTSEKFYPSIVTSRTYKDRLDTLDTVKEAGLMTCCGGILGLGEDTEDRLQLLRTLSNRDPHPESVPINRLTPISGTPLADNPKVSFWELIRIISITRILMPASMIRLSSGRKEMPYEQQLIAFFAGANSIFSGDKLLTVDNTPVQCDREMFQLFGIEVRKSFKENAVK
jgi:biotin synthase